MKFLSQDAEIGVWTKFDQISRSQGVHNGLIVWVIYGFYWFKKEQGRYSLLQKQIFKIFSSVQSLSHVRLFATPWTAARQASLSITNSWSLLKFMSIESVMASNHPILCHPLLLLPSIFPRIRVFSNVSFLCIRQPKYWSFSFSIFPMNIQDGFPLEWTGWISLQSKELLRALSKYY